MKITVEHEYYIRFILLLLQAGTDLLREIIKKALHKRSETLQQFLNSSQPAISNDKRLNQIQKDTLYPPNAQGASIDDFDITLLSHLINNYLNKDIVQLEMDATNEIRQLRNTYNAHTTEAKMDPKTFTKEWNKLVRIIINVDTGMSSEVGQRHGNMIDSIENDPINFKTLVQEIKNMDMSRVFFENIQHCLESVQEDLNDINKGQKDITKNQGEIKEGQEQLTGKVDSIKTTVQSTADTVAILDTNIKEMKAELLAMKEKAEQQEKVLEKQGKVLEHQGKLLETTLKILAKAKFSPDDQETKDMVTASLHEACKNFNANVPPTNAVQEKVFNLCTSIETLDVTIESISSGSIIFEFKCFTLTSIIELIDYFYTPSLQKHLDEIAEALADMVGKPVSITALGIDEQSLKDAIADLKEKENETVLELQLSCRGIDGLLHVLKVFEEGKAANSLNELSEALSEAVGKPIKLHTSIDVAQMKTAIQKIKDQLAAGDSQNSSVRLNLSKLGASSTEAKLKLNPYHLPKEPKTDPTVHEKPGNVSFQEKGALATKIKDLPIYEYEPKTRYKHEKSTEEPSFTSWEMFHYNAESKLTKQASSPLHYHLEPTCEHESGDKKVKSKEKFEHEFARALHREHHSRWLPDVNQVELESESYNDERYTKPNLKFLPETMTKEQLGEVDHSRSLTGLSIKSSSHEQISYDVPLIYKKDIHLKDNYSICCFAVLSSSRILVADDLHETLTVVNIPDESEVVKRDLNVMPCGIAVLPNNQAAVMLYEDCKIIILSTNDLSTIRRISINKFILGITSYKHELYVICNLYLNAYVLVINLHGDNLREIVLDINYRNDILSFPHIYYWHCDIAVSKDNQSFYITNRYQSAVIRYSLQGLRTGEYKLEMDTICGLTVLDDGSLLVCSETGTIHHLSADLKQGQTLNNVTAPRISSIAYDADNQLVYISSRYKNIIKVLSLEKKPEPEQFDNQLTDSTKRSLFPKCLLL